VAKGETKQEEHVKRLISKGGPSVIKGGKDRSEDRGKVGWGHAGGNDI